MTVRLDPKRVVANITLVLMDDGSMSIEGNVGDVRLALGMIDSARAAIESRLGKPTILEPHGAGLAIPNKDVVAPANERVYPLVAVGDRG
jgi:hypothetical protein